jgi:hypothetical protein
MRGPSISTIGGKREKIDVKTVYAMMTNYEIS